MGHVDHQQSSHFVGYLAHALVVPLAAVGRATADNQLGFVLQGQPFHLVIVHVSGLAVQRIADVPIEYARGVDLAAVREMAALVEVEAHKDVAGLQHGQQYGLVGLSSGVRLHVGKFCIEEPLDALDGQRLHLVDNLATAVIAFAGQSFGIFVGEIAPGGSHHFLAYEVL